MSGGNADKGKDTSYDRVRYESQPFAFSHSDHLAVIAALCGLEPPSMQGSRVLELGCASGNNIIPMAFMLPGSSFLGVDYSAAQIESGTAEIGKLSLKNIELRHCDLNSIDPSWGLFDYVICHGTLSWVPPAAQTKIFEICQANLSPNGIVYISYNTYPGWHLRKPVRDMLLYESGRCKDPGAQIEQAKAAARFFSNSLQSDDKAADVFLRKALSKAAELPGWYLFHDLLEQDNYPYYFLEFMEKAAAHDLAYLADADAASILPREFSLDTQEELKKRAPGRIEREQLLDFMRVRLFRQSVLCRAERQPREEFDVQQVKRLSAACALLPVDSAEGRSRSGQTSAFANEWGRVLETTDPILQKALLRLGAVYPEAVPFAELYRGVRSDLELVRLAEAERAGLEDKLAAAVLRSWLQGHMRLSLVPPRLERTVGAKAYPLARMQAERGAEVVNIWHEVIELDPESREMLLLLDGTKDITALVWEMTELRQMHSRETELLESARKILRSLVRAGLCSPAAA